jgi:hypothetical protein
MPVEIDETELLNLRNVTAAVHKMLKTPGARSKLLAAQKEANPNAVIPEIDSAKPVYEALGKVTEELKSLKEQREADIAAAKEKEALAALTAKWEKGRSLARRAGYTEDGLQALESFMETNGVADHMIAMPAFERLNPPQAPVADGGSRFDMFAGVKADGDDTKMLLDGNEQQFLTKRIRDTLSAVRTGNLN